MVCLVLGTVWNPTSVDIQVVTQHKDDGMKQNYDIIGDIHGHADALEALLSKLEYVLVKGTYQHEKHKVIFLGDFIDRGPQQRKVIEIVKPMVEQGFALSVMGNHEFNAICYATSGANGRVLREHSEKNTGQHKAFLNAYPIASERKAVIEWFRTLPIYIETDGIRVIHASWNEKSLREIFSLLDGGQCLLKDAYEACSEKGSIAHRAIEVLLKGPETDLPDGVSFKDTDGNVRHNARIKWWVSATKNKKERIYLGEDIKNADKVGETDIDRSHHYLPEYPPLFVGHYWLNNDTPDLLSDNCACLDYSIAKKGKLVSYSWRGEVALNKNNFKW